jgi:hypothetical protein
MAWIGTSGGIFKLHDSDNYCGSYISLEDTAEILGVNTKDLSDLRIKKIDGENYISELEIHQEWSNERIKGSHSHRYRNAYRSFDELIVMKLLDICLPGSYVEYQIPFGRKLIDIRVTYKGVSKFIEFVGPSHFIPTYQRRPISPLLRKAEIETEFKNECIIWPFWIQRCNKNIQALFSDKKDGLASVWSTKAFFGDFYYLDSTEIIQKISDQFGAIKESGIGYMYGNTHTIKPKHPIIEMILQGKETRERLIPNGNSLPNEYWLPVELWISNR